MCLYERVSSIYKCFHLTDEFFCCENLGCCYSAMPFCYDWVCHIYSCKFFNIIEILLNFFHTIELNFRKISNFHHNRKSLEKSIHSAIFISRPNNTICGIKPLKPILQKANTPSINSTFRNQVFSAMPYKYRIPTQHPKTLYFLDFSVSMKYFIIT